MTTKASERYLDVSDLFILADALQIELTVSQSDQIDGKLAEMLDTGPLVAKFPFELTVVSSRVTWQQKETTLVSVEHCLLLEGPGDFLMLALNDTIGGNVHVAIIDREKTGIKRAALQGYFETRPDKRLIVLVETLRPGIKLAGQRDLYGGEWSNSDLLAPPKKAVAAS